MIVEEQIHGGIDHGIGNAWFEPMVFDRKAKPLTVAFGSCFHLKNSVSHGYHYVFVDLK